MTLNWYLFYGVKRCYISFRYDFLTTFFTLCICLSCLFSIENRKLLQNAELELKKSKRKDYYKILSVSKEAPDDEIKKAYRKHALLHHPGKRVISQIMLHV